MSPAPEISATHASAGRRFAIRIGIFYGTTLGLAGTYLPFFPVWLKAIGIDSSWIGLITAVPSLTRFTVLPVVTRLAERMNALRSVMIAASCLTLIGFIALQPLREPLAVFIVFALTASVWTPLGPLSDGYALKGCARYGLNYGPLRLWGSVAFVGGTLICGVMLDVISGKNVIWVLAGVAALNALVSFGLRPLDQNASGSAPVAASPMLLRNPVFIAVIVAAGLIQGSHAAYYTFASIVWREVGLSGFTIAGLWSLGVVAEIVVFALSPRFTISPATQMLIGALAAVIRWIITAQEPPLAVLAAVQIMHGLTFGIVHLGAVGLLVRLAPGHVIATAQGYLVASNGALTGMSMILSGALYGSLGQGVYYVMAVQALAGAVIIASARSRLDRSSTAQS